MIFTAILMYIILAAAVLSGVLAVYIAASTLFSSKNQEAEKEIIPVEEVQVFARKKMKKENKKKKEKPVVAGAGGSLIEKLAELPEGYHVLTGLELKLTDPVRLKDIKSDHADVDYLVMGPKRIFILKQASTDSDVADIKLEEKIVSTYLKKNLMKDYRVVGWLVGDGESSDDIKTVSKDGLIDEIIKLERYSQGKKSRPVGEDAHEILSILKLSRWESGESDQPDHGSHVFA